MDSGEFPIRPSSVLTLATGIIALSQSPTIPSAFASAVIFRREDGSSQSISWHSSASSAMMSSGLSPQKTV